MSMKSYILRVYTYILENHRNLVKTFLGKFMEIYKLVMDEVNCLRKADLGIGLLEFYEITEIY